MANAIQFHLSFNNGAERLQLPVNPESLSVSSTRGYEDITITRLGEYTVIGDGRLREFSLSSFFPRDYNPSYCEYDNIPLPWDAIAKIEHWKNTGKPMRLAITGTPINLPVTLRRFDYDAERAGSVGDIYYDLSFKEYVFVTVKKYETPANTSASGKVTISSAKTRPNPNVQPKSYVVKSGDSLSKIAARIYGSSDRWRDIYNANKAEIGPNPNLISVGQTLVIPA